MPKHNRRDSRGIAVNELRLAMEAQKLDPQLRELREKIEQTARSEWSSRKWPARPREGEWPTSPIVRLQKECEKRFGVYPMVFPGTYAAGPSVAMVPGLGLRRITESVHVVGDDEDGRYLILRVDRRATRTSRDAHFSWIMDLFDAQPVGRGGDRTNNRPGTPVRHQKTIDMLRAFMEHGSWKAVSELRDGRKRRFPLTPQALSRRCRKLCTDRGLPDPSVLRTAPEWKELRKANCQNCPKRPPGLASVCSTCPWTLTMNRQFPEPAVRWRTLSPEGLAAIP